MATKWFIISYDYDVRRDGYRIHYIYDCESVDGVINHMINTTEGNEILFKLSEIDTNNPTLHFKSLEDYGILISEENDETGDKHIIRKITKRGLALLNNKGYINKDETRLEFLIDEKYNQLKKIDCDYDSNNKLKIKTEIRALEKDLSGGGGVGGGGGGVNITKDETQIKNLIDDKYNLLQKINYDSSVSIVSLKLKTEIRALEKELDDLQYVNISLDDIKKLIVSTYQKNPHQLIEDMENNYNTFRILNCEKDVMFLENLYGEMNQMYTEHVYGCHKTPILLEKILNDNVKIILKPDKNENENLDDLFFL